MMRMRRGEKGVGKGMLEIDIRSHSGDVGDAVGLGWEREGGGVGMSGEIGRSKIHHFRYRLQREHIQIYVDSSIPRRCQQQRDVRDGEIRRTDACRDCERNPPF